MMSYKAIFGLTDYQAVFHPDAPKQVSGDLAYTQFWLTEVLLSGFRTS